MSPESIGLVTSVIRLTAAVIENHVTQQNELLELFAKATEEGRDLTSEEVARYRAQAAAAMKSMEQVNPLLQGSWDE